ncbi:glycosyltransferase [Vibrio toranzoniae]|uniref:glycosyltransferase n=1 Tax=Vibrio toranzoniae TaxID=1194427 RepID=UPI0013778379|nr:glycosyltransferase [Vibrio toranzoniae]
MTLFVSVVNHNHDEMICDNSTLKALALEHQVIIKSNTQASTALKKYCKENQIHLIQGTDRKGFGANNNEVFRYVAHNFYIKEQDYFLILNPDVEVDSNSINQLIEKAKEYNADISTINLFTDRSLTSYDQSIRRYPTLLSPLKSLAGIKRNDIYNKSQIKKPIKIEWAAGSFLLFKVNTFKRLDGFDEKYFMYFEDADICTRANKNGFNVYYFPYIKAIHFASHQNRKLFSKHFIWYWKSSIRYNLSDKH